MARFDVADGTAQAQSIVLDTQDVLITGSGKIDLGSEQLDLKIHGPAEEISSGARARADGYQRAAHQTVIWARQGPTSKQGGVAAALGTLLTPVAAMLAFVDPGLAKDQDCSQLLAQAHGTSQGPA